MLRAIVKLKAIRFSVEEWAQRSASLIQGTILKICDKQGACNVMLTGGRSAERLYTVWRNLSSFGGMHSVTFFFGDERCVPSDDSASNYGLAMRTLFGRGIPPGCSVLRMEADDADRECASLRYESLLPNKIHILLLGVGEDGHIASLFPGGAALGERSRKVLSVIGDKAPRERMTISPIVIEQSSTIFVLADGKEKAAVLRRVLATPNDHFALPACLVKDAIWLLDTEL